MPAVPFACTIIPFTSNTPTPMLIRALSHYLPFRIRDLFAILSFHHRKPASTQNRNVMYNKHEDFTFVFNPVNRSVSIRPKATLNGKGLRHKAMIRINLPGGSVYEIFVVFDHEVGGLTATTTLPSGFFVRDREIQLVFGLLEKGRVTLYQAEAQYEHVHNLGRD